MVREVVAETWRLFVRRLWRTLVIVGLLLAPLELIVHLVDPGFESLALGWFAWVGLTAAIGVTFFPWVIGALIHDTGEGDESAIDAYRQTAGRLPDLILSALVTTVGIALGTIAFVVPGLILLARWAIVVPLIVLDGDSWRVALRRSNELVRGHTGSVIAVFLLLTLIAAALVAIPVTVAYSVIGGVLGAWLATLAIDTVGIAFYSFAPLLIYRRLKA